MRRLMNQLYNVDAYTSLINRARARVLYGVLTLFVTVLTFLTFIAPLNPGEVTRFNAFTIAIVTLCYSTFVLAFWFVRRGHLWRASLIIMAVSLLATLGSSYNTAFTPSAGTIWMGVIIILSAILFTWQTVAAVTAFACFVAIIGSGLLGFPQPNGLVNVIIGWIATALFTIIAVRLASNDQEMHGSASAQERLRLAEVTASIARQASLRAPLADIMNNALNLILANYPQIYHAQVFLVDEQSLQARLAASTGEVGQLLLARGHTLTVGGTSVIGQVTLRGEPIIARAGGDDSVHRRNEFLPDTQVEAAFPMQIGGNIIGALDLQSKEPLILSQNEQNIFQALANSLALAIDNARQMEQAEARAHENQRLAEQARNALRQVERLNERLIGRAWSAYLQSASASTGLDIDLLTNHVEYRDDWTETLTQALSGAPVDQKLWGGRVIAVPLKVRGYVVGAMEFELDEEGQLSEEDKALIEEISERFGLAAENARLVQESQRVAQREALVNEIATRLQASNNVAATLTEAARSLQDTLKLNRVKIRLGAPVPHTNGAH